MTLCGGRRLRARGRRGHNGPRPAVCGRDDARAHARCTGGARVGSLSTATALPELGPGRAQRPARARPQRDHQAEHGRTRPPCRPLGSPLDPERYETLLLHGAVGAGEASLADRPGAGGRIAEVPGTRPELARRRRAGVRSPRPGGPATSPGHRPHPYREGGNARPARGRLAGRPTPIVVHTYHGHVLEGYFGPLRNAAYRGLERRLARVSDRLIGVSPATVDELVRLGVAPRAKFRVVPLGLDLEPFLAAKPDAGREFRAEMGGRPGTFS